MLLTLHRPEVIRYRLFSDVSSTQSQKTICRVSAPCCNYSEFVLQGFKKIPDTRINHMSPPSFLFSRQVFTIILSLISRNARPGIYVGGYTYIIF